MVPKVEPNGAAGRAWRGIAWAVGLPALLVTSLILATASDSGPRVPGSAWPALRGRYLGQTPPHTRAEMFAPGAISTEHHDDGPPAFSPDGRECFWRINGYHDGADRTGMIFWTRETGARWSEPRLAPFSRGAGEWGLCMQPDGRRLYYWSRRPRPGDRARSDGGAWFVDRTAGGWSEPQPLVLPVDVATLGYHFSVGADGSLLYTSAPPAGQPGIGVYRLPRTSEGFAVPKPLGIVPERPGDDLCCAAIAPDAGTLVFTGGAGNRLILLASFRQRNGDWSVPVPLGDQINAGPHTKFAGFSPDGKFLFFVSNRPANPANPPKRWQTDVFRGPQRPPLCDVYWVDARALDALRPAPR